MTTFLDLFWILPLITFCMFGIIFCCFYVCSVQQRSAYQVTYTTNVQQGMLPKNGSPFNNLIEPLMPSCRNHISLSCASTALSQHLLNTWICRKQHILYTQLHTDGFSIWSSFNILKQHLFHVLCAVSTIQFTV